MKQGLFIGCFVAAAQAIDIKSLLKDRDPLNTNTQPIIGIVSQPLAQEMIDDPRFTGMDSYMMAAYVKFMEASGARVVPLIWGEDWNTTLDKLLKINGVLFPGGDGDYVEFGRQIINFLQDYNDQVDVIYPAWGTCLGFENMLIWASDAGADILGDYVSHESLKLEFTVNPTIDSVMWANAGLDAYKWEQSAIALNSHSYSVNPDSFTTDASLAAFYKLTSISYTVDGNLPFGETIEAYHYPFFGTQFHPEKPMTMWNDGKGINHSAESIRLNRYMTDRFMQFARQNTNYWGDYQTVQGVIVQNCRHIVMDDYYGEVYAFSSSLGCIA